jgi:predicted RNase H-like HicB family nuclease
MTGYAIIIEGEGDSFSAYAPELPGCIATGSSIAEVEERMREAIRLHIELMEEDGDPIGPLLRVLDALDLALEIKPVHASRTLTDARGSVDLDDLLDEYRTP